MFYQIEPLFPGLTRIWDVARTAMYLVEGADRAVLIDTGVGVGDLKSVVAGLTDKPVTVLLTHGHVDHALGAVGFDDVRMNPLDKGVYAEHCDFGGRKGYVMGSAMQGGDPALVASITDADYLEPRAAEDFAPLAAGDTFDLGGVTVQLTLRPVDLQTELLELHITVGGVVGEKGLFFHSLSPAFAKQRLPLFMRIF